MSLPTMPHFVRRVTAASVLLIGMTAITGCADVLGDGGAEPVADIATAKVSAENGLDQLAPADALAAVTDALEAEGSFHVAGSLAKRGSIDMTYVVGTGAMGTIGDSADDGSPVELVATEDRIYVAGDKEFLIETVGRDAAKTIGGKWLRLAKDSTEEFKVVADGQRFAETVLNGWDGEITMTGVQEVDGVPAIGLLSEDTGSTLWVAATDEPLPLRLEEKGASGGDGVLKFSDIGAEVKLAPPADNDVVDAEGLASD